MTTRRALTLLAGLLLLAACSGEDKSADRPATPTEAEVPVVPTSAALPDPTTGPAADPDPSAGATPLSPPEPVPLEIPADLAVGLTPLVELPAPVALAPRAGTDTLYVADKGGTIVAIQVDGAGAEIVATTLDLVDRVSRANEQGLLGLAFSPDGERLYVDFTDSDGTTTIAEYRMDGDVADTGSERILLTVEQPAANHNAGDIHFGPDGFLYVTLGDGGGSNDQFGNGQNVTTLLGSVLRIDPRPSDGSPYAVPGDNPFAAAGGGRPEIYLFGTRNPWKISFDRSTGDLWVADVGQNSIEEVNVLYTSAGSGLGANLGWSLVEGTSPFRGQEPPPGAVGPRYEYDHGEGCSVTGGYVYRGSAIADLDGVYVFGDYCTSVLWGLVSNETEGVVGRIDLGPELPEGTLAGFGQDNDGELYVLALGGAVYRVDPTDA